MAEVTKYDLHTLNHPIMPIELYESRGKVPYREGKTKAERACPECGSEMTYKHTTGTYRGKTAQRLVYMICKASDGNDHGYGPKSRHCDADYRTGSDETAKAEPKPNAPAPAAGTLDQIIGAIIDVKVGERLTSLEAKALDPEAVKAIVGDMIASGEIAIGNAVKTLEIQTPTEIFVSEGLRHPVQDEILERCALGS